MNFILTLLILVNVLLVACAPNAEQSVLQRNEKSAGVIYGEDSRSDIDPTDPAIQAGNATAILFEQHKMSLESPLQWVLKTRDFQKSYMLCADEKFLSQPVLGFCSGVLIAPNKVLTAGHCVAENLSCESTRFMFGWNQKSAQTKLVNTTQVYSCKKIDKLEYDRRGGVDYAIIELDREVEGVEPVKVAKTSQPQIGDEVLSLSYPLGIPLKKDLGVVSENIESRPTFRVKVDTFSGSSGSPLFNKSGELIGILSSGMEDFLEDDIYRIQSDGGCLNFNRCKDGTCFGEMYFKTDRIDL